LGGSGFARSAAPMKKLRDRARGKDFAHDVIRTMTMHVELLPTVGSMQLPE
jgi:hypothetical protein